TIHSGNTTSRCTPRAYHDDYFQHAENRCTKASSSPLNFILRFSRNWTTFPLSRCSCPHPRYWRLQMNTPTVRNTTCVCCMCGKRLAELSADCPQYCLFIVLMPSSPLTYMYESSAEVGGKQLTRPHFRDRFIFGVSLQLSSSSLDGPSVKVVSTIMLLVKIALFKTDSCKERASEFQMGRREQRQTIIEMK
ncbi:Hypothetical protein, putative, partial [Bodo saltans]